jgi:hypothetical protein
MGSSGSEKVIQRMKEKIEARGGRMVNSFAVKTGGMEMDNIYKETKRILEEMDLEIYGIQEK